MNHLRLGLIALALGIAAATGIASADTDGSAKATWKTNVITALTVTPNFQSGYGTVAPSGAPTPNPTPTYTPIPGYVDFGKVIAGYNYLYRYAAQVSVLSNDANGFSVYGEGTADFSDGGSNTVSFNGTLFYLFSSAGNTPYSPASPFRKTTFPVTGSGASTGINYGGSTPSSAPIWTYPTTTSGLPGNQAVQGFDYELHLPSNAPTAIMSVYVVYTVVAN